MVRTMITSKGQVTIPKPIRDSLQLNAGDKVDFLLHEDGQVLMRPVTRRVDDVFGILHKPGSPPRTIKQMNAAVRRRMGQR